MHRIFFLRAYQDEWLAFIEAGELIKYKGGIYGCFAVLSVEAHF